MKGNIRQAVRRHAAVHINLTHGNGPVEVSETAALTSRWLNAKLPPCQAILAIEHEVDDDIVGLDVRRSIRPARSRNELL